MKSKRDSIAMSLLIPASSRFLLSLLALGGLFGGTATQTHRQSSPPLSSQSHDRLNDTRSNVSARNGTLKSTNSNEESVQTNSTFQELSNGIDETQVATTIRSSGSGEEESFSTISREYDSDGSTDFPIDNSTTTLGNREAWELLNVEDNIEEAQDSRRDLTLDRDSTSTVKNDVEVETTNEPALETLSTRATTSPDSRTTTDDDSSPLRESTVTTTLHERASDRESARYLSADLRKALSSTYETSFRNDGESYETVDNLSDGEPPTTDVGEDTKLAAVTQKSAAIEGKSGGSESELKWKDRNESTSGAAAAMTGNSIPLDDQRTPVEPEVGNESEVPHRKWNKTRESYAGLADKIARIEASPEKVGPSIGKAGHEEISGETRDIGVAEERIIATEPSRRFMESIANSEGSSTSGAAMDASKRNDSVILQVLRDSMRIAAQRLKVDEKLLHVINGLTGKANTGQDGFSAESCGRNAEEDASNKHTGNRWNHPWNGNVLNVAVIPQVPWRIPTAPKPDIARFLPKSSIRNARSNRDDYTSWVIESLPSNELSRFLIPDGRINGPDSISANTMPHHDLRIFHKTPAIKCTRVCRVIKIAPKHLLCRRTKALCKRDFRGYKENCISGRIICTGNYDIFATRRTKLICQNILMPVNDSKVDYKVYFLLGLPCNMKQEKMLRGFAQLQDKVDSDDVEYTSFYMHSSESGEVEQVYGNESELEWDVGDLTEESSFPEAMGSLGVSDAPDFAESFAPKDVDARPTSEALSPEVVEQVLLEAIRRLITDDEEKKMSQKPLMTHLDTTGPPMPLTNSAIIDRGGFMDGSTLPAVIPFRNLSRINRIEPNIEGDVERKVVNKTQGHPGNKTSTKFLDNIITNNPNQLVELLNRWINHDINHEENTDNSFAMDTNHFNENVNRYSDVETSTSIAEVRNADATPQPTIPIDLSAKTEVVPVEPQPVAATTVARQSSETTPAGATVKTSITLTPVNARQVAALNFDAVTSPNEVADDTIDIVRGIMQTVSASLFDLRDASNNVDANHGADHNENGTKRYNNERNLIANLTRDLSPGASVNVHYRRNAVEDDENLAGDGRLSPIGHPIGSPPASTANIIIVNGEKYVNLESDRSANVGADHNANFNQRTEETPVARDKPIEIASLAKLEALQQPHRSPLPQQDTVSAVSSTVNSRVEVRDTSNKNHRSNLTSNEEATNEILEKPMTQNVEPAINPDPESDDAAAKVDSAVNRSLNQSAQFAMNQSGDVGGEADSQRDSIRYAGIDSSDVQDSSLHQKNTHHVEANENHGNIGIANMDIAIPTGQQNSETQTASPSHLNQRSTDYEESNKSKIHSATHQRVLNSSKLVLDALSERNQSGDYIRNANMPSDIVTNHNDSLHLDQNADGHVNLLFDLNAAIETGVRNVIQAIAGRAVNAIVTRSPLKSANSIRATESPTPIINANGMISDVLNSVGGIGATSLNGAVSFMQQPGQPSRTVPSTDQPTADSASTNQPTADSSGTSVVERAPLGNSDSRSSRQHQKIIHATYNSNLTSNSDANNNSNRNGSTKVEEAKVTPAIPSQIASSGIADTTDSSDTKHERGWFELWYNNGDDPKNDRREIWNNKKFKRFLEQQLWELKEDGDLEG